MSFLTRRGRAANRANAGKRGAYRLAGLPRASAGTSAEHERRDAVATTPDDYRELYTQVCESYRSIDDFRMKLLGLLPVATGAGVLALLSSGKVDLTATGEKLEQTQQLLLGVAGFGVAITLGLFAYELHGIMKCGQLIKVGALIEKGMGTSGRFFGQFETRPHRFAHLIDVPFASCVVYSASVAVWVLVGLVSLWHWTAVALSAGSLALLTVTSVLACRRFDDELDAWDGEQELGLTEATATNA